MPDIPFTGLTTPPDLFRFFLWTRWACERCGYFVRGLDRPSRCACCGAAQIALQHEPQGM